MDFNNSDASWSYSGFMVFRKRLAKEIGIENLDSMWGFGGNVQWDKYKDDPIYILLYHSDCDGDMSPEECGKVAPRLRELVAEWSDNDDDYNYLGSCDSEIWEAFDKRQALLLAEGMEYCAETGEKLRFQ